MSLVGFGAVGQGLARLLLTQRERLQREYDLDIRLVSVANSRHGCIFAEEGLDIAELLALASQQKALTEAAHTQRWDSALEGIRAIKADVMVEATLTNLRDAEPGLCHIRTALERGMHVVTANKGPIALAARELLQIARTQGVQLRMEATVMAGTPVLSTAFEGMAGTRITAARGIFNGTTNYILSAMAEGREYAEVLADAQALGYAEADPTADVEGYDALAKAMILSALLFEQPLTVEQVTRTGITGVSREQVAQASEEGKRIKLIASVRRHESGKVEASVEPVALPLSDALAHVNGAMNAITFESEALAKVTVIGPGAGGIETGQGLLTDILAIARS
ncbi:homoserine dehydrogenase [Ktedonospora formicarum]|uniref:Homoserine dehydrogenase n=1 Tax=Ktedonospora formicarum TaxID=2778364 RepID=A0A8J3HWZ0_9CHLR|nr:homoserine dehydrogenase [Ktedonospora formicarum]